MFVNSLSSEGINYYMDKETSKNACCTEYWLLFKYFHQSPMIKMFYHFVSKYYFLKNIYLLSFI